MITNLTQHGNTQSKNAYTVNERISALELEMEFTNLWIWRGKRTLTIKLQFLEK